MKKIVVFSLRKGRKSEGNWGVSGGGSLSPPQWIFFFFFFIDGKTKGKSQMIAQLFDIWQSKLHTIHMLTSEKWHFIPAKSAFSCCR